MNATLQKLLAYNKWATESLLSHMEQQSMLPSSSLALMQHIINAESIWTSRISNEKALVGVWEAHNLGNCRAIHRQSCKKLALVLNTRQDLNEEISYLTSKGDPYTDSIHDILIHVFNHATYHRAQIAKDLRQNGLEPINTDYIQFVRLSGK